MVGRRLGKAMLDDVRVFSRLDSELFGAMAHAAEVVAAAVNADLAAACAFGAVAAQTCYLTAPGLSISAAQTEAFHEWPGDEGSLFAFIEQHRLRDGVFRPREEIDEITYARLPLYRRLQAATEVTDALCISCDLSDESWCTLALLRCSDSAPFCRQSIDAAERYKPAVARVLSRGFKRETQPRGTELHHDETGVVNQPVSAPQLLAKLSKTELHVLSYLRNDMTERRIAEQLGRSPHTVHVHVKNIYRKLGVTSRKNLARLFND